jgi:hypothetical protein
MSDRVLRMAGTAPHDGAILRIAFAFAFAFAFDPACDLDVDFDFDFDLDLDFDLAATLSEPSTAAEKGRRVARCLSGA